MLRGVATVMKYSRIGCALALLMAPAAPSSSADSASHPVVLHAAHLLEVDTGRLVTPAEVLIDGERIVAVGSACRIRPAPRSSISARPRCCRVSSMRTCICFCIPAPRICRPSKNLCRSEPSWRCSPREADLMAGFTAERDMGTEGAGSADTAVRDAIDQGLIPGPRLRICGNAIDILGGHEDAIGFQSRAARVVERRLMPTTRMSSSRPSASSTRKARIS